MAFGEMLTGIGVDNDARGVFWYDLIGSSQILRSFLPTVPAPTSSMLSGAPGQRSAQRPRHEPALRGRIELQ